MRYTTIIDIREYPALYRNPATRLVYLHLVLVAGYHDHDRDLASTSVRRLAKEVGVTISAVRHALDLLIKYQLLVKEGPLYKVRKFVVQSPITKRAQTARQMKAAEVRAQEEVDRELRHQERARQEEQRRQLRSQGKTSFMLWYEEMMKQAAQGNPEAIEAVRTNKDTYAQHAAAVLADTKS